MIYYLGTYLHDTVEVLSFLRLLDFISFRTTLVARICQYSNIV